jgi:hypothetical protein
MKLPIKSHMLINCVALFAITLSIYWQAGNHEFLNFDDNEYVTNNSHVTSGLTGENIVWAFTSFDACNWHPITWLSHMTDAQLFGINPRGHHLTNVIVHATSSVLLLFFLFRFTGSLWKSSFVATLFALHPLHVESVAWVAERKDVLCAFFWFLALLFYSEYAVKAKSKLYILSLLFYILGIMSKPMIVTLPIVMLLVDFWPLGRYQIDEVSPGCRHLLWRITNFVKEKIPFFACSLFSAFVTVYAQEKCSAMMGFTIYYRIKNVFIAYVEYIFKTLWPHNLAIYYPYSYSIPIWQAMISLLILLLISFAAICTCRQRPYLFVGWLWFLVTLMPVIGLIKVGTQSMADRYTYVPAIGLYIMVAWGVSDLTKGLRHQRAVLGWLACSVITVSTFLTNRQLGFWQNNFSLYRHTLQVTSNNYLIQSNLVFAHIDHGIDFAKKGNIDAAIQEFQEALRISPNYIDAHFNLGIALGAKGDFDASIREFKETLHIDPNHVGAQAKLKLALALKQMQGKGKE